MGTIIKLDQIRLTAFIDRMRGIIQMPLILTEMFSHCRMKQSTQTLRGVSLFRPTLGLNRQTGEEAGSSVLTWGCLRDTSVHRWWAAASAVRDPDSGARLPTFLCWETSGPWTRHELLSASVSSPWNWVVIKPTAQGCYEDQRSRPAQG